MTPGEMDELERLWNARVRISDIADRLGYAVPTVQGVLVKNRDRYPHRHRRVPRSVAELWVERIKAGRATVNEAARKLGVHPVTVAGWLRRYGNR